MTGQFEECVNLSEGRRFEEVIFLQFVDCSKCLELGDQFDVSNSFTAG